MEAERVHILAQYYSLPVARNTSPSSISPLLVHNTVVYKRECDLHREYMSQFDMPNSSERAVEMRECFKGWIKVNGTSDSYIILCYLMALVCRPEICWGC